MAMTFTGVISTALVAGSLVSGGGVGPTTPSISGSFASSSLVSGGYSPSASSYGWSSPRSSSAPVIGAVSFGSITASGNLVSSATFGTASQTVAGKFASASPLSGGYLDPATLVSMLRIEYTFNIGTSSQPSTYAFWS